MIIKAYLQILNIKTKIQNILRWLWRKICITSSVRIIKNGKVVSVYWRYVLIFLLFTFKFIMIENMYNYFCSIIDVKAELIQIVRNVNYVDKYVIYKNKNKRNTILNAVEYVEYNLEQLEEIILLKKIIQKCVYIDEKNEIDIKSILMKYANVKLNNHTIKNILLFNGIKYSEDSKIIITYRNFLNNMTNNTKEYKMIDINAKQIQDLL